jgi:hypothetical protein
MSPPCGRQEHGKARAGRPGGRCWLTRPGGAAPTWPLAEIVLTTILVRVILNMATGSRSIGYNAAIAVVLIVLVRGMPRQAEWEAAEGGELRVP